MEIGLLFALKGFIVIYDVDICVKINQDKILEFEFFVTVLATV